MTSKEALENIKDNYPLVHPTNYKLIKESYDTLEKLVERDTPMKVTNGTTINEVCLEYECPRCKQGIDNGRYSKDQYYLIKHCISCGQRLDWEEE